MIEFGVLELQTSDGRHVEYVAPMLPNQPQKAVLWGQRIFVPSDKPGVYRETLLCLVEDVPRDQLQQAKEIVEGYSR